MRLDIPQILDNSMALSGAAGMMLLDLDLERLSRHMSYSLTFFKEGLHGALYRGVIWGLLRVILVVETIAYSLYG